MLFLVILFAVSDPMKEKSNQQSKKVAEQIRQIRLQRNYTQEYLAAELGISQNAYSKTELGYSKITIDRLFHIASILEVPVVELLYPEPEKYRV